MNSMSDLIRECEEGLRAGRIDVVAAKLKGINTEQIPNPDRVVLARFARRAGLVTWGLRILAPRLSPNRKLEEPNDLEKAEYAVLLQRSGLVGNALDLLNEVDTLAVPEAGLYKTYCLFNLWDYEAAVPVLESYLKSPLDPYQRLIGQVNLASALVITMDETRAFELLERNIAQSKQGNYLRLLANSLEMRADLHLRRRDLELAEHDLTTAAELLSTSATHDQLFVRKSQATLKALKFDDPFPLKEFRMEALDRRHWESVREADLNSLIIRFDQKTYEHLYFGSPWPGYRRYIERRLGQRDLPASYDYGDHGQGKVHLVGAIWDLQSGILTSLPQLRIPKSVHQVICSLAQDLYRPKSVGTLFSELFPGEFFDVFSSPNRVHQVVKRARKFLKQNSIPGTIESSSLSYWYKGGGGLKLRVPLTPPPISRAFVLSQQIRLHFGNRTLTSIEISEALSLGKSQTNAVLKEAIEQGLVAKQGQGRAARYGIPIGASSQPA